MSKYQGAIFCYAIILILGGIYAFLKGAGDPTNGIPPDAHRAMSAGSGIGLGILSIFFATLSKSNPRIGYIGASVTALIAALGFTMAIKGSLHEGRSPAFGVGMMVVSIGLALFLMSGHFLARRNRKTPSIDPAA